MTWGDRIVVAAVIVIALLAVPIVLSAGGPGGDRATLEGPFGVSVIDLGVSADHVLDGHRGNVHVRVVGGRVRIVEAECPDQACVRAGFAAPGKPLVCVPNGVVVSLGVRGGETLDAVSR